MYLFGFKIYKIKDRSIHCLIYNKVLSSSFMTEDNEKPAGFFFARGYIGYIHNSGSHNGKAIIEIYILAKPKTYAKLTTNNVSSSPNDTTGFKLYYRTGNYFWLDYSSRYVNNKIKPTSKQDVIVKKISTLFEKSVNHSVSVYIYGESGSGKSTIPILVAIKLGACLCKTFNPTDPGDNLNNLYNKISPSQKAPLVIVFEEVDILIKEVHDTIARHRNIPTLIYNKPTWNTFFDDLKTMYPNLVLIMTSNKNPVLIDELDPSYLREGRVDDRIHLSL